MSTCLNLCWLQELPEQWFQLSGDTEPAVPFQWCEESVTEQFWRALNEAAAGRHSQRHKWLCPIYTNVFWNQIFEIKDDTESLRINRWWVQFYKPKIFLKIKWELFCVRAEQAHPSQKISGFPLASRCVAFCTSYSFWSVRADIACGCAYFVATQIIV